MEMASSKNMIHLTARVPAEYLEKIDMIAEKNDLMRTDIIRMALSRFLKMLEKQNYEFFPNDENAISERLKAAESTAEYNAAKSDEAQKKSTGGESIRNDCA